MQSDCLAPVRICRDAAQVYREGVRLIQQIVVESCGQGFATLGGTAVAAGGTVRFRLLCIYTAGERAITSAALTEYT